MYYTIRQEAKLPDCPYTEYRLRQLVAQGQIPGIKVGNRFLIAHEALVKITAKQAIANLRASHPCD